jgi:predicted kinase
MMLIVFAGLPGTGKSSIARELARGLHAVWLRMDTIEEALRRSGVLRDGVEGSGYEIAYRLAEDNLGRGLTVLGDCVNPLALTRSAWRDVAKKAGAQFLEVEVICSDKDLHRRRIETRNASERAALEWNEVIGRDYEPWRGDHLVIDTALHSVGSSVALIVQALPPQSS